MSFHPKPVRPFPAHNPPLPHLISSGPPLNLLPPSFFASAPELEIPGYTRSTHVFPAAWPRSTCFVPVPSELDAKEGEGKAERKKRLKDAVGVMLKLSAERQDSGDETVLWLTATRWVRNEQPAAGGKTLLSMHANGLHAVTAVPLLRHLLQQRDDVAEVWALDCVQHGDAALLNAGKLGALFDWRDTARDALCFLTHFLPPELSASPLPLSLSLVQSGTRKIHALGHSLGGYALAMAAARVPDRFAALVLVDPAFGPPAPPKHPIVMGWVGATVSRRDAWPSRAAAHAALRANPLFGAWDEQVLDIYAKHALVETTEGVKLKCARASEAAVFADERIAGEMWQVLPSLDVRVPLLWVIPPAKESIMQLEEIAAARLRLRPANSAHTLIPTGLHLLVQTNPRQVADAVNAFLKIADEGPVGDARVLDLPSSSGPRPRL